VRLVSVPLLACHQLTFSDCLALLQGHTSLVGQIQLIGDRLLTGGSDGRVIVFDLSTYECLHRLCAHDNSVTCLQFDDRFVISGGMDGRVKLWDIRTGMFIRELTKPCTSVWRIGCRDDRVVILAQRGTRTVLEVLTFRPGEVMGKTLEV
jgi:F-box and WD-40 domain protein CDC4